MATSVCRMKLAALGFFFLKHHTETWHTVSLDSVCLCLCFYLNICHKGNYILCSQQQKQLFGMYTIVEQCLRSRK